MHIWFGKVLDVNRVERVPGQAPVLKGLKIETYDTRRSGDTKTPAKAIFGPIENLLSATSGKGSGRIIAVETYASIPVTSILGCYTPGTFVPHASNPSGGSLTQLTENTVQNLSDFACVAQRWFDHMTAKAYTAHGGLDDEPVDSASNLVEQT